MSMYVDQPTGMGTPPSTGAATEQAEGAQPSPAPEPRTHRPPQRQGMLEEVANDLALWIDQTATEVALAFAPGRAPFAANLTEQQKIDYYSRALFNPDGRPNQQGRQREVARLGVEQFAQVYEAVLRAHPEWRPPSQEEIEVPEQWPSAPAGPPPGPPPMMPPGA